MNKKIAVAILGYNSQKYLDALFNSLLEQERDSDDYYYIDNASHDASVRIAQRFEPRITVVQNSKNNGYAGAYGIFLENAFIVKKYDAVILLNPDVIVDRKWSLQLVSAAYADPMIAIAQSKVLQLDKNGIQSERISSFGGMLHYLGFGLLKRKEDARSKRGETDFCVGTSMLIKREAYEMCGGLDHDFFMYLEDLDLSWRMRICGYQCIVATDSVVWHHYVFNRTGDKNRRKFYYVERNRLFCLWKNYSYRTLVLLLPALLIMECGILCHAIVNAYIIDKVRANWDFLREIPVLHKKHCDVQAMRTVSDREIFDTMATSVQFDELDSIFLRAANVFFILYYKIMRMII